MTAYPQVFLALLFAHLLGDFPLQTRGMVLGKVAMRASAYLGHGLVHLLVASAALALFTEVPLTGGSTLLALVILVPGHLALDLGKSTMLRALPSSDGALLYTADQAVHVLIVALAAAAAVQVPPPVEALYDLWMTYRNTLLVAALVIAATVFPTGYLIRYMLKPLSNQLAIEREPRMAERQSLEGLSNAGLYLGWLERGLLVIAFAIGSFTAVGLIIGAKSVARFPEFRSRAFAEYFLIGTLISVAFAAVGGSVLRLALDALAG
jgi:hypothetical protein